MRLKIRSPAGGSILDLPDDATISALYEGIRRQTSLTGDLEIKYSFPPKPLSPVLSQHAEVTLLSSLPVKLQGEQLIVSGAEGATTASLKGTGAGVVRVGGGGGTPAAAEGGRTSGGRAVYTPPPQQQQQSSGAATTPFSFTSGTTAASAESSKPLSLTRAAPKWNKDDPPDVPLPGGRGTVVLRVMEDDNSCLFRALSYVMTRSVMSVTELRQLVAGTIQENTTEYSAAVLEQSPDAYCEWIKMESSWGGGIELGILAEFFDMEICTVDVGTGNMIRFNEGKDMMVIVAYSGIHYDAIALSPAGAGVMDSDMDEVVFKKGDVGMLDGARDLCRKLREQHYFTDTNSFTLRCNICKKGFKGQMAAVVHAKATGHHDFGEY